MASPPRKLSAAYRTVSQWVIMVPGCMIHDLIDISAIVIPFDLFTSALLLSTCPRKATKTVTYDNSILLAKKANSSEAVEYGRLPLVVMR